MKIVFIRKSNGNLYEISIAIIEAHPLAEFIDCSFPMIKYAPITIRIWSGIIDQKR